MSLEPREVVERLYGVGEAVAGSEEARRLSEELSRLISEVAGSTPRVVRFPVATWRDRGARVECGGLSFEGATLPQTLGGVVEGRLVEVHCTRPPCFAHVSPGDIVVAEMPEDPDDITTLYVEALEAGAEALVVYDRWPGRLRRIVVSGRWDYAHLPSPAPMLAVYLRREHGVKLVKNCTGSRVRVEAEAELGESTGRTLELVIGRGDWEVVIMAHYDHWLGGSGDNLAGVASLLRALQLIRREGVEGVRLRVLALDAEEFGDPELPAWYWAYGSRWYASQLARTRLLDEVMLVVNLEMPVTGELVLAGTPEARLAAEKLADGLIRVKRVEEFETCYSDGYSFATLGAPSVTLYNVEDYLEWYHTDADTPDKPLYESVEAAARLAARLAVEAGERGPALLDYEGYAGLLESLAAEAPVELSRAVYSLAEETRMAVREGRWRRLREAYGLLNSRLGRCVFNDDYRWGVGGFEPRVAPRLRAALEALREASGLGPGDRVVPGDEMKLATATPTPVRLWLEWHQAPRGYRDIVRSALSRHLRRVAIETADVILEAYRVLRG